MTWFKKSKYLYFSNDSEQCFMTRAKLLPSEEKIIHFGDTSFKE